MAILGIDHLVIAVRNPDDAAVELERELGLAFTGGGRHETAGTWNRLAFLGDSYVELIGVFDRSRLEWHPDFAVGHAALALLDAGREGLATWAVAVGDCATEVARLRRGGSPIGDPIQGSRVRPDGETVRWTTAFPSLGPEGPPFLIQHEMSGAEWGPEAMAARRAFRHPGLGGARLGGLVLPVGDPAAYAERCEHTVGIRVAADRIGWTARLGDATVELVVAAGAAPKVRLDAPVPDAAPRGVARFGVDWHVSAS